MGQIFMVKMRKLELRDVKQLAQGHVFFFKDIYVTRLLGFPITLAFSKFRSDGISSQVVS